MQKSHKDQPMIKVIGHLDINGLDIIKRIYSIDGLSPTLSTMMGGQRQPKIVIRRNHE
jgi:DNA (cytosine-5)-methyltransferase 1